MWLPFGGLMSLDHSWQDWAACVDLPTDVFYPVQDRIEPDAKYAMRVRLARGVCARCPVRVRCLTYAVTLEVRDPVAWGIWGGHTAGERTDPNIRHMESCDKVGHQSCRPIPEQVGILEELFAVRRSA
jgi:WhiB family redox-sensing transcriptional regulator